MAADVNRRLRCQAGISWIFPLNLWPNWRHFLRKSHTTDFGYNCCWVVKTAVTSFWHDQCTAIDCSPGSFPASGEGYGYFSW